MSGMKICLGGMRYVCCGVELHVSNGVIPVRFLFPFYQMGMEFVIFQLSLVCTKYSVYVGSRLVPMETRSDVSIFSIFSVISVSPGYS